MILIAIPYHENKRYCLDHIADWVQNAKLDDTEVIMRWHKGPFGEPDAVKKQREFFRKLALQMNASHLLFIGADTIPPLDALPRLLAHNLDVVGGLYNARLGGQISPIAWKNDDLTKEFSKTPQLIEIDGMGMDCVLLSKRALESFSYFDWEQTDDDYPAYNKLRELGIPCHIDTSIICKHYSTNEHYL